MNSTEHSAVGSRHPAAWLRNWSLAAALFLLSFQPFLYLYAPLPELFERVPPAFASVYLKPGDIAILSALAVFLLGEPKRIFALPAHVRRLAIPTLLLAALTLVSMPQARLPLLTIVAAARLVLVLGLSIMVGHSDSRWVIWPLVASALASALLGAVQYALRSAVGLAALGEAQITAQTFGVPVVVAEGITYLRAIGFTVHPNVLAPYLAGAITLLLGSALRRYPADPWPETLGVGVAAMGLALTYSRVSWISVALGGAILGAGHVIQPHLRARLGALKYPLIVGVLVFGMFAATQSRQIASRFGLGGMVSTSATDRLLLMQNAMELFGQHPLTGVGGHNFAVQAEQNFEITNAYSHDFLWQPVHNFTALVTTELGLGGGLVWLWLTIAPWWVAISVWRKNGLDSMALAWLGISVFLAWNGLLDHFVWSLPEGMGLMWVVWAGLAAATERCRARTTASTQAVTARAGAAPLIEQPRAASQAGLLGLPIERGAARAVLSAFLVTRLMIFFVILVASLTLPLYSGPTQPAAFPRNAAFDGLIRWNSFWYESVARFGYFTGDVGDGVGLGNIGFLPGYPLLTRAVALLVGNRFLAGILVSNAALIAALAYLYRLAKRHFDDPTAQRAVFYLAAAPTSVFFSAMYPESFLLAAIIAAFYYASRGQWGRAGLAGLLASATGLAGLLATPVIALEGMHQQGVRLRPPAWTMHALVDHLGRQFSLLAGSWRSLLAAAIAPLGLLAYAVYLWVSFGEPLGFVRAQSGSGLLELIYGPPAALTGGLTFWLNVAFALGVLPLVALVAIRLRPAYAVFAITAFVVPLNSMFLSTTRTTLLLFPCYMLLADWGRRSWVDRLVVGIFLPLMALFATLFSRWYWAG